MTHPRLLDLFCGAGGCSVGYDRAGFDVTGVDIEDHPDYPFPFMREDARDVLWALIKGEIGPFDVVHASPPCQAFTAYRRRGDGVGNNYPDLIYTVRTLLNRWGGTYVIENVPGAPLVNPVQFCGSSFGLDVRRHRLFESNAPLMAPPCIHGTQRPRFAQATNRANLRKTVEVGVWRIPLAVQQRAMGIDWMTLEDLTEAVPPAFTEHIGGQILDQMERAA